MSQEDMKRLLKDGKIVGYMYHSKGKILFAKDIKNWLEGLLLDIGGFKVIDPLEYYIKHDSFEQGIKVGDEWWFINDRGKHIGSIHDEEEDISKGIKRKAREALTNAIHTGKIERATKFKCAKCGNSANEYHHHKGYEKEQWLEVMPICYQCHKDIHFGSHSTWM